MDEKTGQIYSRPDGMTDAEWREFLRERGLVEMHVDVDKDHREAVRLAQVDGSIITAWNRKARRAAAAERRRKK